MTRVSVIIPCFNQGQWLEEAVSSALAQDYPDLEVVVVNDGSTDPVTCRIIATISHPRVKVISTRNQGLAAARNEGVRNASGDYLLPLDSDDRIAPSYVGKAVALLDERSDLGVVYCRAEFFGEQQGIWELEPYSFPEILISPQIFASSMFRRSDWEAVGGYRSDMIYGWEDYDFWLSLVGRGLKVHRIDEILFFYRRTAGSMAGLDRSKMLYSFKKLYEHHRALYEQNIGILFEAAIDAKPRRDVQAAVERFELYLPVSSGYAAGTCLQQSFPEGVWSRVSFDIGPLAESGIHQLRLDPGRRPGLYDIASLALFDSATGSCLWKAAEPSMFAFCPLAERSCRVPHERFLRLWAIDDDPFLFIPKLDPEWMERPVRLEIWVHKHVDLSVLSKTLMASDSWEHADCAANLRAELEAQRAQSQILRQQQEIWETRMLEAQAESHKIHAQVAELRSRMLMLEAERTRLKAELEQSQCQRDLYAELRVLQEQVSGLHKELSSASKRAWWRFKG
jgi:glycosyltransferase involved in cell wall biosynthesis